MPLKDQVLHQLQNEQFASASKLIKKSSNSSKSERLYSEGLVMLARGERTKACALFSRAVKAGSKDPDLFVNYSYLLNEAGDYHEAARILRAALKRCPFDEGLTKNLIQALLLSKRHPEALELLENLLEYSPRNSPLLLKYAEALHLSGRNEECLAAIERVSIEQLTSTSQLTLLKSNALISLGQPELACSTISAELIKIGPKSQDFPRLFNVYIQRSIETSQPISTCVLDDAQRNKDALTLHALALYNDHHGEQKSAERLFNQALLESPSDQFIRIDFGKFLARHNRNSEAQSILTTKGLIPPISAEFYYALGTFFHEQKKEHKNASVNFLHAYKLEPDNSDVLSDLLLSNLRMADWKQLRVNIRGLCSTESASTKPISPFVFSLLEDSTEMRLGNATNYCKKWYSAQKSTGSKMGLYPPRIAYISSDFRTHAVGYLIKEYIALHNSKKFDISLVYTGPLTEDPLHSYFRSLFNFIDLTPLPKSKWLPTLKSKSFDIVIELNGHTAHNIYSILSHRISPIQVNFLGFPGTSGLSNIDYIIADSYVIPEGGEKHYSEEVYRLPICYQPSDSKRDVALNILKKSALGISDCHFVFCCLNNAPKINEFIASAWVKILKRCPSSVLVLLDDNAWSTDNISRFFVSGGVDKARIVFFPRVKVNQHLARHQVIDLFLDTFPYGAHTTANDAIFSDVPVLTLFGHGFASRVAYSLNMHIDMPELCTDEIDQYIETACRFYSDEKWFKDIKDKLREGKRRYGFSNSERFAHEMEVFWERALAGQ